MIYPLVGGLAGYTGARLAGVEDGLAVFGIALVSMVVVSVGGFLFNRRSGR